MSALIGALRVSLSMDTAAFEKGADYAQKQAASLGKRMQKMGDKLTGIGAKMSIGITAPFAALVSSAIPAAIESREAIGQVNAALASMGPVAGKTSEQLQKMAGTLQSISTFDDDDILKKVTANMLTFGNISGEAFDRAQLAAVNLSARLGQDLQSSAIQVGKALNDPIKGLTSLARVGIQFTDAQKTMIKRMVETGNLAGAQGIILGELERQFGGAAKAARAASPTAAMNEQWRTLKEKIGEIALQVLPPLTAFLTKLMGLFSGLSPTTQTWVIGIVALSAALGPVLLALGSMITIIGSITPLVAGLTTAFVALKAAFIAARIAAIATLPALTPFLVPLGLLAAAVGAVYLAWRNWDNIKAIVGNMVSGVSAWLQKLAAPFQWVIGKAKAVGDAFFDLYDRVVGRSYIPDMVDEIGVHMGRLQGNLVTPAQNAVAATNAAFSEVRSPFEEWAATIPQTAAQITEAFQGIQARGLDRLGDAITDVVMGTRSLGAAFKDVARSIIAEIIKMTVRMLIFRAVSGILGGGKAPGSDIIVTGSSRTSMPGFATGGAFDVLGRPGRDRNMLALNGLPIAKVSHGERVSVGSEAGGVGGRVEIILRDEMLDARIAQGAGIQIVRAAPEILKASTMHTARSLNRPRLA